MEIESSWVLDENIDNCAVQYDMIHVMALDIIVCLNALLFVYELTTNNKSGLVNEDSRSAHKIIYFIAYKQYHCPLEEAWG